MRRALAFVAGSAAVVAAAWACVPADTRPAPGSLLVTISPSPAVAHGTLTADGWTVTFDRVLLGIGNAGLGQSCAIYGEANYDRLLDVKYDAGQKLGLLHGLGVCDVDFRVGAPSVDAIVGPGATEADKDRFREGGVDFYQHNPTGIAAEIALTATRGGETKRFVLDVRTRLRFRACTLDGDASTFAVDLQGNVDLTYDIAIEAEAILRDDVDAAAPLRFDPFAKADTDGDGIVTLGELAAQSIDEVRDGGAFEAGTYEVDEAGITQRGRPILVSNLADWVYEILAPTMPRWRDTGQCLATLNRRGPN